MKNIYKTVQVFMVIMALTCTTSLSAQPSFDDDVEDGIPLDGGLSLLIASAAAYGIKKLRNKKNEEI